MRLSRCSTVGMRVFMSLLLVIQSIIPSLSLTMAAEPKVKSIPAPRTTMAIDGIYGLTPKINRMAAAEVNSESSNLAVPGSPQYKLYTVPGSPGQTAIVIEYVRIADTTGIAFEQYNYTTSSWQSIGAYVLTGANYVGDGTTRFHYLAFGAPDAVPLVRVRARSSILMVLPKLRFGLTIQLRYQDLECQVGSSIRV
jgi:hypothetical protein